MLKEGVLVGTSLERICYPHHMFISFLSTESFPNAVDFKGKVRARFVKEQ